SGASRALARTRSPVASSTTAWGMFNHISANDMPLKVPASLQAAVDQPMHPSPPARSARDSQQGENLIWVWASALTLLTPVRSRTGGATRPESGPRREGELCRSAER